MALSNYFKAWAKKNNYVFVELTHRLRLCGV